MPHTTPHHVATMPSFASLTRTQKRDLILAESHTTSAQITLSPSAIDTLLAALAQTPNHQLDAYSYSRASSAHIINENWGVDVASFPALHHQRDFRPESWDARLLAVLAILSEYTQGQGVYMGSLVCYAVEFRVGNGRRDRDLFVNIGDVIRRVIRDLLQPLREEVCFCCVGFSWMYLVADDGVTGRGRDSCCAREEGGV